MNREAFEDWYNKEHPGLQAGYAFSFSEVQNEYTDGYAQMLWEAWQAALSQQAGSEPVGYMDSWEFRDFKRCGHGTLFSSAKHMGQAVPFSLSPQPAVPEEWREKLESIRKSIVAVLDMPEVETHLSRQDRDMLLGCEAGCGELYRLLNAPESQR